MTVYNFTGKIHQIKETRNQANEEEKIEYYTDKDEFTRNTEWIKVEEKTKKESWTLQ